jgi:NAD(P)-dependent dehydrogenase (short-subunit alcohol dehydrogenase family)
MSIEMTKRSFEGGFQMKKLTGKVAVVTGASKGIGAAIAKQLAADGANVVVNYATSREGADKVVAEITNAGGKAIAVGASVAKEADVEKLFAETRQAYGKVDILVNNAGVYGFAALEQVTVDEYKRQSDTNVLGLLLATKAALPLFPPDGGQRDQHQFGGKHARSARGFRLCIDQRRRGYDHESAGKGTWVAQDPRECDQPRPGDHGGYSFGRHRR